MHLLLSKSPLLLIHNSSMLLHRFSPLLLPPFLFRQPPFPSSNFKPLTLKVLSMASSHSSHHIHTNRLASEQSPYLLQHAHNPVDWYPWGEEAFAEARRRDAPIFLSSNSLLFRLFLFFFLRFSFALRN
ncbi:hypothetical protein HKD37_03G008516 [Glycine soja]